MITEVAPRTAPVGVGFGIVRVKAERHVVVRNGSFMITKFVLRITPIVIGSGIIWGETEHLSVGIYRCFVIVLFTVEIANGEPRLRPKLWVGSFNLLGNRTPPSNTIIALFLLLDRGRGRRFCCLAYSLSDLQKTLVVCRWWLVLHHGLAVGGNCLQSAELRCFPIAGSQDYRDHARCPLRVSFHRDLRFLVAIV